MRVSPSADAQLSYTLTCAHHMEVDEVQLLINRNDLVNSVCVLSALIIKIEQKVAFDCDSASDNRCVSETFMLILTKGHSVIFWFGKIAVSLRSLGCFVLHVSHLSLEALFCSVRLQDFL